MSLRDSRLLLVAGGVIAAVILFLVLRPSDDGGGAGSTVAPAATATETEPAATQPAETTATATAPTEETTPAETAPAPEPAPETFAARLAGGTVVGGIQRWSVRQGDRVRIVVRSDRDDELHLHGYDVEKEVGPSRPAVFAFQATLAGRFELEAHHGGGQIAQLDVQP
jgi:hypothetical protein